MCSMKHTIKLPNWRSINGLWPWCCRGCDTVFVSTVLCRALLIVVTLNKQVNRHLIIYCLSTGSVDQMLRRYSRVTGYD